MSLVSYEDSDSDKEYKYKIKHNNTANKKVKISVPKIPYEVDESSKKLRKNKEPISYGLFNILPQPKHKPPERSLKFDANIVKQKNLIPKSVKLVQPAKEDSDEETDFFSFAKTLGENISKKNSALQNLNIEVNSAKTIYQSKSNKYFSDLFRCKQSETAKENNDDIPTVDINAKEFKEEWRRNAIKEETVINEEQPKEEPSFVSRRKHQITYLAYEAKKNEEQYKNQWAMNRMTRKQTQAKYGF